MHVPSSEQTQYCTVYTLLIDTALSPLTVGLAGPDGMILREHHELIGRGHAEALMPALAEIMGDVPAVRIVVGVGPGSFTGIRVGIAAARALALAWRAELDGISSLAATACAAFRCDPDLSQVAVTLDAHKGEVYAQTFVRDGDGVIARSGIVAVPPPAVWAALAHAPCVVVGSGAPLVVPGQAVLWPQAQDYLAAARHLQHHQPVRPLYVRAPDAKLPA